MLSDEEMYERMRNGWRMGRPFTNCGNGSTMEATANAREWLPRMALKYDISVLNDAGAGDKAWIRTMRWPRTILIRSFDLIDYGPEVVQCDITRDVMPPADALLCRMVLNHLDEPRILMALDLFRQSTRYLIATQFDGEDLPQRSPQFTRLDLRKYLGPYDDFVQDGNEGACKLALWRIA